MNFIVLTHANNLEKIIIVDKQIAFIYFSKAHDATFVVASGGAIVPVKETKEQITSLLKEKSDETNR